MHASRAVDARGAKVGPSSSVATMQSLLSPCAAALEPLVLGAQSASE
jgi:hypothetical protein